MNRVLIGFGGNLGDSVQIFKNACAELSGCLSALVTSGMFISKPVYDKPGAVVPNNIDPDYINAVICARTALSPQALLKRLLEVECALGRGRPAPECSPRTIDLDLLLYSDRIIYPTADCDLEIPHPRMHRRAFVLVPACEVAPEWIHPVLNQSLERLCAQCQSSDLSLIQDRPWGGLVRI